MPPRALSRYAVTVGALLLALIAASSPAPGLAEAPFLPFFAALLISAWYGGLGPTLLATVLAAAGVAFTALPPIGQFHIAGLDDRLGVTYFATLGIAMSALSAAIWRGRHQVTEIRQELERARTEAVQASRAHAHECDGLQRALATARREKDQFAALLAHAPLGLGLWDRDLRFVYLNEQLAEINGLPMESHLGRTPQELLPKIDGLAAIMEDWRRVIATQTPLVGVELSGQTPSAPGVVRHWRESFFPVKVGDEVIGLGAVVEEITAQRQAEERFRELEETVDVVFWIMDVQPRPSMRYVSSGFARLWGLDRDAACADHAYWMDRVHAEDRVRVAAAFQEMLDGGQFDQRYRITARDGSTRWVHDRAAVAARNAAGQPRQVNGIAVDITDYKMADEALRESEERLRLAFDAARMGWWDLDLRAQTVRWSENLKQVMGFSPDDFGGTLDGLLPHIHPDDRQALREAVQQAIEGRGSYARELRFVRPDGTVRWALAAGQVFCDEAGEPMRMSGIDLDITDRKQAEGALLEADRRKDQFLATLAHELRNPLAPIRNAVELLRRRGEQPEIVVRSRDIIARQIVHLTRLVDDLLDVSRISHDKLALQKERLDLGEVLDSAVEASRPLIEARNHQLMLHLCPASVHVFGDAVRLIQVVANLLNNAANYTSPGGRIALSLDCEDTQAVIRVRDTGIGIDPSKLPEVFEPFYQVARASPNKGGIGIGLALVKGLVRMHDGVVEAHSAGIGQGSEFVVRLPLSQRTPAQEAAKAPAPADAFSGSGKGRVLVVDDNLDSAESLAMLLELEGFKARTAHDGVQALVSVESFQPDVVLLDLGMPIMDGFETCRRLCDRGPGRPRAIVALTGWGSQLDRQGTTQAGFDAHLVKPVEPFELVALLERLVPVDRAAAKGSGSG